MATGIVLEACTLFAPNIAHAALQQPIQLQLAHSIKCRFGPGTNTEFHDNVPRTVSTRINLEVTFEDIDLTRGTARIVENIGSSATNAIYEDVGITFTKITPNVIDVTTIFSKQDQYGNFEAVNTRHSNFSGEGMGEQYFGVCGVQN